MARHPLLQWKWRGLRRDPATLDVLANCSSCKSKMAAIHEAAKAATPAIAKLPQAAA
jgi:hypothetical protein